MRVFGVAGTRPLIFPLVFAVRAAILDVQQTLFVFGVEFGELIGQLAGHSASVVFVTVGEQFAPEEYPAFGKSVADEFHAAE